MPFLLAFLVYAARLVRKPIDARFKSRQIGPFLLLLLASLLLVVWVANRPPGTTVTYLVGEIAGVSAIYLSSWSLILATRAHWLEPWFGGLDRMYFWHKRCAVVATLLFVPHVLLTGRSSPNAAAVTSTDRAGAALGLLSLLGFLVLVLVSLPRFGLILRLPYHRWLFLHRLIGLFVALALIHGLILDEIIAGSALLETLYFIIGGLGLSAYGYDEVMLRRRVPVANYTIDSIARPSTEILELHLAPTGEPVTVRAGSTRSTSPSGKRSCDGRAPGPSKVSRVLPYRARMPCSDGHHRRWYPTSATSPDARSLSEEAGTFPRR